ncbi:MurR/RpiR family transcriptional regulator [Sedimentibacter sp. zth1]|uniref:MurR/RpiR family transcriptional regulator n=1 Tax=Sedimentibacter sp. zth1 TaxID=2816908 RepID=UPI001A913B44|nr:MurR/RpiR family transcriptional regulator [Sedimentibacter sp. zth1]QSX06762.1 MurR/RpiR family transcriptional regulator [Sedimentibacter sp. zth1]
MSYKEIEKDKFMNIIETINKKYNVLTNKQKIIANYLKENPSDICYITLSELSKKIGCSEVTILKFTQKIGLTNFVTLKKEFRNYNLTLVNKLSTSSYTINFSNEEDNASLINTMCDNESKKMQDFLQNFDSNYILEVAEEIASKRIIYLFAHDSSKILAKTLECRLLLMQFNPVIVDLADMKIVQQVLKHIDENDICIFFAFPNYYYCNDSIAETVREKNCDIILITDDKNCPVSKFSKHILVCNSKTIIFRNSLTVPISMINLLTSAMALIIGEKDTYL